MPCKSCQGWGLKRQIRPEFWGEFVAALLDAVNDCSATDSVPPHAGEGEPKGARLALEQGREHQRDDAHQLD